MAKTRIEKIRDAAAAERIGASTLDLLVGYEGVRDWADGLTDLADCFESAESAVQDWVDAEGREAKADARDEAVGALLDLLEAWDNVAALAEVGGVVAQP